MVIVYILVTLLVTILGTISGMGGGVVLKPVIDAMGEYDAATVGIMTASTAFAMALVSFIRNIIKKTKINYLNAILLGIGAIGGGYLGHFLLEGIIASSSDLIVKLCQNSILGGLIVVVFCYIMLLDRKKATLAASLKTEGLETTSGTAKAEQIEQPTDTDQPEQPTDTEQFAASTETAEETPAPPRACLSFNLRHPVFYLFAGVFLGTLSSFLGIGGGPINVALLMLLFGMDIKGAAIYSLIAILFSQTSKLFTVAVSTGFSGFDLKILPYLIISAVIGALAGGFINKKISTRVVSILFNVMQGLVMAVVIYNIITICIAL